MFYLANIDRFNLLDFGNNFSQIKINRMLNSNDSRPETTNNIELIDVEKEFVNNLNKLLKERGIKPTWLARQLGYSDGWISNIMRYKRGEKAFTLRLLYDIADKLNVDPASLLPNINNPEPKITFDEYIDNRIEKKVEKILEEFFKKKEKKD